MDHPERQAGGQRHPERHEPLNHRVERGRPAVGPRAEHHPRDVVEPPGPQQLGQHGVDAVRRLGHVFEHDIHALGVAFTTEKRAGEPPTARCLILVTPDGERTMNTFLGISATLSITEIDEEALKASKYVYIEGYLVTSSTGRPAAIRLRELAHQHQVKTAISLSDPAIVEYFYDDLRAMVGEDIDLLFCNRAEALRFTRTDDLEHACAALRRVAKTFVMTLGSEGAAIFDGTHLVTIPAPKVQAVDTNGAGDMFAGAFLYAITQGSDYVAAGELAVRAAAQVVSQFGPRLRPEQHQPLLQG